MSNEDRIFALLEKIYNQLQDTKTELANLKTESNQRFESLQTGQDKIIKKLDAVYEQTADLTEFRTETKQDLSDIKDTLRFILHKEIETEKEIFKLKEKSSQIKQKKE